MNVICQYCEKRFSRNFVLKRHLKNVHHLSEVSKKKFPNACPIEDCNVTECTVNEIRKHLSEMHGFKISEDKKVFENIDEFKKWKEIFEVENKVYYKKARGDEKYENYTKQYYICNRSGVYTSKNTGKRLPVESCKIGAVCPAYLNVTICHNSNKVHVALMNTHIGHTNKLKFLRLPQTLKMQIACQIKEGVNSDKILESVRSVTEESLNSMEISNYRSASQLLTKKDINNIQVSFGLKGIERHSNDAASVHLMFKEYSELPENPFLICKLQGEEAPSHISNIKKEDIFIVLMNALQTTMLKKFGEHLICIDSTHGTNGYDFSLITLMIVDEFGEGFPVAWLISNHETENVLKNFFQIVKSKTGEIKTQFFMSDDAEQFYNGWVSVFEHKPKKLLCIWHVDRAWCQKLNMIPDTAIRAEVYSKLCLLRNESCEKKFEDLLNEIRNDLKELDMLQKFKDYFEMYYVKRCEQWALCYRKGSFISTNMYLEAFHKTLKHVYLKGKINKRLDRCIHMLFSLLRDKSFDRIIKLEKGKSTKRIAESWKRHRVSLEIPDSSVTCVNDSIFKVTNGDIDYTVEVDDNNCNRLCELKCKVCNVCIHTSRCSCPDYTLKGVLCKHIHLTVRVYSPQLFQQNNENDKDIQESNDHVSSEREMPEKDTLIPEIVKNEDYVKKDSIIEKKKKI